MILPSPELVAVMNRWHRAMMTRDPATLRNLLSTSAHLRYVGSAENELWTGDVLRTGFVDHVGEVPDFTMTCALAEAFEHGETGWALWAGDLQFAHQEEPIHHRFTFAFALEAGSWKIVQIHCSNPLANLRKYGVEHKAIENLLDSVRKGFAIGQREGMATVMFTDIADSSTLAELIGDRNWAGLVASHFAMVRAEVEAAGGRLIKSLGDGTMSSFSSAAAAIRAATAIQDRVRSERSEPRLRLRVGMHTGDVIQTDDDFFGSVVNKAARIAAAAEAGETLVSDAVRAMAGDMAGLHFADPVQVPLKGFEGMHLLCRVDPAP